VIINSSEVLRALVAIESAPYQFHFTGSRFFGHSKPNSDWDFFVQGPLTLVETTKFFTWLRENGFRKDPSSSYYSGIRSDVEQVWQHRSGAVHIQVVKNATLKSNAQKALASIPGIGFIMGRMSKEDRKILWHNATTNRLANK
jgi:hypothetical protein